MRHEYRDTWAVEHAGAFTVAKRADPDLPADIRGAVDKALAEGTTLERFQRDLETL